MRLREILRRVQAWLRAKWPWVEELLEGTLFAEWMEEEGEL